MLFSLFLKGLQLLLNNPPNDLLEDRRGAVRTKRALKIPNNTLLDDLPHHVDLDINLLADLLRARHDFLLRVRNQHDLEPALGIIDLRDRQARPVERHIALLDHIPQHGLLPRRQAEGQRIPIGRFRRDGRDGVDVALHEMAAHARGRLHGALKVHLAAFLERAEVRAPQRLRRDPHFEPGGRAPFVLGDRQAGPVHADRVAQCDPAFHDRRAVADRERCPVPAGHGRVQR